MHPLPSTSRGGAPSRRGRPAARAESSDFSVLLHRRRDLQAFSNWREREQAAGRAGRPRGQVQVQLGCPSEYLRDSAAGLRHVAKTAASRVGTLPRGLPAVAPRRKLGTPSAARVSGSAGGGAIATRARRPACAGCAFRTVHGGIPLRRPSVPAGTFQKIDSRSESDSCAHTAIALRSALPGSTTPVATRPSALPDHGDADGARGDERQRNRRRTQRNSRQLPAAAENSATAATTKSEVVFGSKTTAHHRASPPRAHSNAGTASMANPPEAAVSAAADAAGMTAAAEGAATAAAAAAAASAASWPSGAVVCSPGGAAAASAGAAAAAADGGATAAAPRRSGVFRSAVAGAARAGLLCGLWLLALEVVLVLR
eukprot:355985-Chlamydomonas_euryale.AAC.2